MALVSTPFKPTTHGFRFVNYFDFPYLFNVSVPFLGTRSIGDVVIGLCGGMCSAALDYFEAQRPVPEDKETEKIPLSLFRYLWTRQMDTLSMPVLEKLFTWAILDTRIIARIIARDEVPRLMSRIDSGKPALLVLMRARGFLSLTQNHQVLATGYTYDPASKKLTVQLYDPNHPGKIPQLTMDLTAPGRGLKLAQSTGEPLRGVFVIDYVRKSPP
jgi:hypothetical protein